MERSSTNITLRKDGRFMGKFIVGYDDKGKAQYQYVYGRTYDEAESKMLIGQEVASRYQVGTHIEVFTNYYVKTYTAGYETEQADISHLRDICLFDYVRI